MANLPENARRDTLRLRHSVVSVAADAAAGKTQPGYARQLRPELKMLSALPVAQLRTRADELARELDALSIGIILHHNMYHHLSM